MLPGDLLRHARETRKLTLDQAAAQSRIRPAVIEAIESGQTAAIPRVYLHGYVRNYARFLGVDAVQIEALMGGIEGAEPEVRSVFTEPAPNRHGERWLKFSSYIAASALIATLTWQFTHEAVKWSQGEGTTRAPASAGPAEPESTASAGQRSRHLNASIASVEVLSRRSEMGAGTAAEEAWAALDAGSEGAAPGAGVQTLEITTSADTWVEVFGAGERQLEQDLIRAGNLRQYTDDGPFRIMVGRASAVLVSFNGEAVDLAPHTRDGVARLTLGEPAGDEPDQAGPQGAQ